MDISALTKHLIKRGAILHSSEFENIGHGKFFVVMGDNGDNLYGFFFINSNINSYIQHRKALLDMQMPIKARNYPDFLTHDSFLACQALTTISKDKLEAQFAAGKARYKGALSEEDLNLALDAIRKSDLYSIQEKQTYFK